MHAELLIGSEILEHVKIVFWPVTSKLTSIDYIENIKNQGLLGLLQPHFCLHQCDQGVLPNMFS